MVPTSPRPVRLLATSMLLLAACSSDGQRPVTADGALDGPPASDGVIFTDLRTITDSGCAGAGCPCITDDPCIAGGDQTICIDGTCQPGCNANVACANPAESCCEGQCIAGCCDNDDCPPGSVCDPTDHTCGSCETHVECGNGARCCGTTGDKSCFVGNCCETADCAGDGEECIANSCRVACDAQTPCGDGEICCQGYCYAGTCCANPDCGNGQVCSANNCVDCQNDGECGSGQICDLATGRCRVGCNGNVTCGAGSICCGDNGLCLPGASCDGGCVVGSCCDNADCTTSGETCAPDHTCRKGCNNDGECGGGKCCAGFCHTDACVVTLVGDGRTGAADALIGDAYINGVESLAPDGKGNVFFTEWVGTAVRVVNRSAAAIGRVPAGFVGNLTSGVHGCKAGPAAQAEMRRPLGLAFGPDGRLYVADYNCAVIWEISANFSQVKLLAGDPNKREIKDGKGSEAHFRYPRGLTFGPDNRLYVTEHNNHVIRQVALDGTVKTVAGTGTRGEVDGAALTTAQFDLPIGLAMDAGGTLFVGDWESGTVRKVDGLTTGINPTVSTLLPYDLDANAQKPATTVDTDPDPRRRWTRTFGYSSHGNIVTAGNQKLYVNFWNAGIWEVQPRPNSTLWNFKRILATSGSLINQALEPGQNQLWLGGWVHGSPTTYSNTIRLWTIGGDPATFAFTAGKPAFKGVEDGATPSFFFAGCDGALTVDANDNVWIADRCADRVRQVAPDGTVTSWGSGRYGQVAGSASTSQFCYPSALAAHNGQIYVANHCGNSSRIMRINPGNPAATNAVTVLADLCPTSEDGIGEAGQNLCPRPTPGGGMVFDNANNLYVTVQWEDGAGRSSTYGKSYWDGMPMLLKIPSAGSGQAAFFAGRRNNPAGQNTCVDGPLGTGQFGQWPYGLAIDSAGYLYVGDGKCGVRKVGNDGTITTLENEFGTVAVAIGPGPDGAETLFASRGNRIYTVNRITGATAWYAGENVFDFDDHVRDGSLSHSRFWGVRSMAHGSSGDLYVLDNYNGRVRIVRR